VKQFRILSLICVIALLLTGCSAAQKTPTDVTIAMGFIPNVQFAPMYVAIERGYFRDEGIEINLDYGMETDLLQRLASNELQFVVGSGDQVILARSHELPVKYIANWYPRFPVCVVALEDSGIAAPGDLVGKTVGTPGLEGASYIGWLAFIQQVGISPEAVDLQVIGYTQVASLTEGRVDAAIGYTLNEPIQLGAAGYETVVFYLDDYTQLISNGLITNDQTIKRDAKLAEKVVRAFTRGLQDTLDDPDAAFEAVRRVIPEMDDQTAELQRAVLDAAVELWRTEQLGQTAEADWEASIAFMEGLGLVSEGLEPEDVYTNRFVPK